jgi:UDP-GlcNAc:undecaprenyl-phosphate/decaprenyl-phosphate GlcNAc-1-phosphate transferase
MSVHVLLSGTIVFAAATTFSFFLSWALLKSPLCAYFCDPPGKRKVHQRIIPRIGGVSIIVSFVLLLVLWRSLFSEYLPEIDPAVLKAVIFATICICIIGVIDDIYFLLINNRAKFLLEILIAFEIAYLYNIHFSEINLWGHSYQLGYLGIPISMIWMVGITNAANIIDGIDGLASGVLAIGFLAVAVVAATIGAFGIVTLCLVLAGVIIGFYMHNIAPARAFLGDTGALFLGMVLSMVAIYVTGLQGSHSSFLVALLIAGFPILDVLAAMTRRFVKSLMFGYSLLQAIGRMGLADNEHIHHRLLYSGLGHAQTSFILYIFSATFCAAAVLVSRLPVRFGLIATFYLAFVVTAILYKLNFLDRIIRLISPGQSGRPLIHNPSKVGVVQADALLRHALKSYEQDYFTFEFLSKEIAISTMGNFIAVIFVCRDPALLSSDLQTANALAETQQCRIVFISDFHINENALQETTAISKLTYISTPVYVPVLMENIYNLARLKRLEMITQQ